MTKRISKKILALFLAVAIAVPLLFANTYAALITQTKEIVAEITTTVYDALDREELQAQLLEDYPSIDAEVKNGDGEYEDVSIDVSSWDCEDYDAEVAGTYTFTAALSGDYDTSQISQPTITVTLQANAIVAVVTSLESVTVNDTDITLDEVADTLPSEITFTIEADSGEVNVTLAVEEWTYTKTSDTAYTFVPDFGNGFDNAYIYEIDEPSVVVYVSTASVASAVSVEDGVAVVASDASGSITAIEEFSVQFVSGATLDEYGNYVWTATGSGSGHKFKFRVNFATSGEGTIAADTIEIRVPASILNDKNGNSADVVYMSYPSSDELEGLTEEELKELDGYAYYVDGDEIVVYNFKELTSAQEGYFEVSYATSKTTYYYYDYDPEETQDYEDASDTFYAAITAGDYSETDTGVAVYINTSVEIKNTTKYYPTKYTTWQSSWGTQPSDVDAAYYLLWEIYTEIDNDTMTSYYDYTLTENTLTYTVTYSDGSSVSGDLSDGGVSFVAYKLQGESYIVLSSDEYSGFSVTVADQSRTYRYDYVVVALSVDVFEDAVSFTVTNKETATVTSSDDVDDPSSDSASRSYNWTKPTWTIPTGSFNIFKYGNENYSRYFGDYINYSLDALQDEGATEDTYIENIQYYILMKGYAYPWTVMDDWATTEGYYTTSSSGTLIPNYNAYGHKSVTYVITDDTLYPLNSDGTDLNGNDLSNATGEQSLDTYGEIEEYADTEPLGSADYDFSCITYSVTLQDAERDENGDPTVDEDYDYVISSTISETDIITLYVKIDGEWLTAGTYNLYTSTWSADDEGGSYVDSMTSSKIIFNEGVDGYKMELTNSYYYTSISAYAYVTLYATENVQEWIGTEVDGTAVDVALIRNAVVMEVYEEETVVSESTVFENAITIAELGDYECTIDTAGEYVYYSFTPDTTGSYTFYSSGSYDTYGYLYDSDGDQLAYDDDGGSSTNFSITYTLTEGETYYFAARFFYSNTTGSFTVTLEGPDGASGLTNTETELSLVVNIAKVIGDRLVRSERNSYITKTHTATTNSTTGRYAVVSWLVKAWETVTTASSTTAYVQQTSGTFYDLLPYGYSYETDSVIVRTEEGYLDESEYTVTTIDNYNNTGRTMLIVEIDAAANYYYVWFNTIIDWETLSDVGFDALNSVAYETGNNEIADGYPDDGGDISESALMADLDEDTDDEKFIYAEYSTTLDIETAQLTGLLKEVKAGSDSIYSSSTTVASGETYSYKLRYANTYTSTATGIILYDSIENYGGSEWYGTLTSIDLTQVEALGIAPVVYVSTIEGLDVSENADLSNTSVWEIMTDDADLSTVTAVAIDLSTGTDGEAFVLGEGESVVVILYMTAPVSDTSGVEGGYPTTYNNVYAAMTVTTSSGTSTGQTTHYDYTSVSYAITGDFTLYKVNEQDNTEEIQGITFVLYGTSDYGTEVDIEKTTNSSGIISFTDIEKGTYTLQEYGTYDDWVADHTEYTVVIDENSTVTIDGVECTTFTIENTPRVHADIVVYKMDSVTGSYISEVTFRLYGTSDYGNTVNSYATTNAVGKATFSNIEKGTYTLVEAIAADGYFIDGAEYTVKVDSYGNVSIEKANSEGYSYVESSASGKYIIYNMPYTELTIIKRSSYDNQAVSGVEFALKGTSTLGNYYEETLTTDDTGIITFAELEPGTYTLTETSVENADPEVAADGSVRIVVISEDGTVTIDGEELNSYGNYVITNTEIASGTISVIKVWDVYDTSILYNDDGTPAFFPTIYLTTVDPTEDAE